MNYLDINLTSEEKNNLNLIFQKCHESAAFKQSLIADPVGTLETITDRTIDTKGFNLIVTDQSDRNTIYLNIPPDQENVELTDLELEMLAGGGFIKLGSTVFVWGDNNHVVVEKDSLFEFSL